MPKPIESATTNRLWRLVAEVDRTQDAGAGGRHHAEHHETGPAQHHHRHRFHQGRHLGQQAQQQHDDAAGGGDPARADAGDPDQPDILGERGVGEGVEDAADDRADAVGAQALGQRRLVQRPVGHVGQRQEHAGQFDHDHDHHQAHGGDRHEVEGRQAEVERVDDVEHRRGRRPCRSSSGPTAPPAPSRRRSPAARRRC